MTERREKPTRQGSHSPTFDIAKIDRMPDTPHSKEERDERLGIKSNKGNLEGAFDSLYKNIKTLTPEELEERRRPYYRFLDTRGYQRYDDSFVDTLESVNVCLSKLSRSLPTKAEVEYIYRLPHCASVYFRSKDESIMPLVRRIKRYEQEKDMLDRVFKNPYPEESKLKNGYILAGEKGTGKTTKLLTHFAGDVVRSFVTGDKILYLDWFVMNTVEFWDSFKMDYLSQVKRVYINDVLNTPFIKGYEGDEIYNSFVAFIHRCHSNCVKLHMTTNLSKEELEGMLSSDDSLGAMLDRFPKHIIEFKGKSFRG